MGKIICLDFHKNRVFVAEFSNVDVLYRLNYLVLECLIHGGRIFIGLEFFAVCLVGLLTMSNCDFICNGWYCYRVLWFSPWCYHLQCGVQDVLHYQDSVAVSPARQSCLHGGGICVECLEI